MLEYQYVLVLSLMVLTPIKLTINYLNDQNSITNLQNPCFGCKVASSKVMTYFESSQESFRTFTTTEQMLFLHCYMKLNKIERSPLEVRHKLS